ncbi:hypothetical protein OAO87_02210 [bacterium]|nr:hypothetical protein [bacterium]
MIVTTELSCPEYRHVANLGVFLAASCLSVWIYMSRPTRFSGALTRLRYELYPRVASSGIFGQMEFADPEI